MADLCSKEKVCRQIPKAARPEKGMVCIAVLYPCASSAPDDTQTVGQAGSAWEPSLHVQGPKLQHVRDRLCSHACTHLAELQNCVLNFSFCLNTPVELFNILFSVDTSAVRGSLTHLSFLTL